MSSSDVKMTQQKSPSLAEQSFHQVWLLVSVKGKQKEKIYVPHLMLTSVPAQSSNDDRMTHQKLSTLTEPKPVYQATRALG